MLYTNDCVVTSIEFFAINDQTNTLPKVMSKAQSILSVASEGVERVGSKKRAIEVISIDEDSDDDDRRRHDDHSPGRSSTTERSKPVPKAQSSPRRIGRDTTR